VNIPSDRPTTWPTDAQLAVWADFLHVHAAVIDVLGHELLARCDLPLTWYDVLLQLAAAPDGQLRMQELAGAIVLSKSGLTRLVDRLSAAGYVERTTCPSDHRGTFASITSAGREALEQARPVHLQGVAEHFAAHLAPDELAALGRAMTSLLNAGVERRSDGLPDPKSDGSRTSRRGRSPDCGSRQAG